MVSNQKLFALLGLFTGIYSIITNSGHLFDSITSGALHINWLILFNVVSGIIAIFISLGIIQYWKWAISSVKYLLLSYFIVLLMLLYQEIFFNKSVMKDIVRIGMNIFAWLVIYSVIKTPIDKR